MSGSPFFYIIDCLVCNQIFLSVAAAATVVLITATAAVVGVLIAASVVACKNKNKDDEKNPVAVASVTKEHSPDLPSHLSLP